MADDTKTEHIQVNIDVPAQKQGDSLLKKSAKYVGFGSAGLLAGATALGIAGGVIDATVGYEEFIADMAKINPDSEVGTKILEQLETAKNTDKSFIEISDKADLETLENELIENHYEKYREVAETHTEKGQNIGYVTGATTGAIGGAAIAHNSIKNNEPTAHVQNAATVERIVAVEDKQLG